MGRSGTNTTIPLSTLGTSYVAATTAALSAALGLNTQARQCPPLVGRLVIFCAVALANGVNTTLMRRLELQHGIMLETEEGQQVGQSKIAARSGISKVILSRVLMTAPGIQTNLFVSLPISALGMVLIPIAMNKLESRGFFRKFPWAAAPVQIVKAGFLIALATPLCCALFEQKPAMLLTDIEQHLQEKVKEMGVASDKLYYNKGL